MTDPAVEAARRVWEPMWALPGSEGKLTAAAREALAPIRELHAPEPCNCHGGLCEIDAPCCNECMSDWPCDTALLIYTSEELNQ